MYHWALKFVREASTGTEPNLPITNAEQVVIVPTADVASALLEHAFEGIIE